MTAPTGQRRRNHPARAITAMCVTTGQAKGVGQAAKAGQDARLMAQFCATGAYAYLPRT